jgi:hypothetical protein
MVKRQARHNWSNKSDDAQEKQDSKQYIHPSTNRTREVKARNQL